MAPEEVGTDIEVVLVSNLEDQRPPPPGLNPPRFLRVICWVFFGVCFALIPLAIDMLVGNESNTQHGFAAVLSHGELALIAAVITAGALGDLISSIPKSRQRLVTKMMVVGLLMVNFALTAMYYAVLRFRGEVPQSEAGNVTKVCLAFFGFGFLASLVALLLSEGGE